jgi:hypothetical protein
MRCVKLQSNVSYNEKIFAFYERSRRIKEVSLAIKRT